MAICRTAGPRLALGVLLLAGCASGDPVGGLSPIATGSISLDIGGLPASIPAAITVTGPSGYSKTISGTQTLTGLTPGAYSLTAAEVTADGDHYAPNIPTQLLSVAASTTPVSASVAYGLTTGRLALAITGLPAGSSATVLISGPAGYAHLATASETLTGLAPGGYTIQSPGLVLDGNHYAAQAESQDVIVAAQQGLVVQASVAYSVSSGVLSIVVAGLPAGGSAAISVTGPGGYFATVTGNTTLSGLVPGSYSIASGNTQVSGVTFVPTPTDQSVAIAPSVVPEVRTVTYAQGIGSLGVNINGLPTGMSASVSVTGPGGYSQNLTASQLLTGLLPGTYTVSAFSVGAGPGAYAPVPTAQNVVVTIGVAASATITYASSSGGLTVTISGLPGGTQANVNVSGPGGYAAHLTASQTLTSLLPGSYTVAAASVNSGGNNYAGAPAGQVVVVNAGASSSASVVYSVSQGNLDVTVNGLPGGTSANVTVTGPGGYNAVLTGSQTLTGLVPGSYSLGAVSVVSGPTTYNPAPTSQSATVTAGGTASATVTYTAAGGGATLNLTVSAVYLTQATQKLDGSVPLVAGRNAYVRVFALANQANTAQPAVRVRLYNGAVLVQTYTITAPGSSVPLSVNESALANSWNVLVPGALVQPNLKVLADVDPTLAVAESNDADNQFPVGGVPGAVDVRALPQFSIRFVPVLQQVNGQQGTVNLGNGDIFLGDVKKQLPVGAYDFDVRATYTTTAPVLQNDNANGAWGTILSEVLALKSTDASTRYYYGVVHTTYGSGVAGMGYVGGSARTAIGWDYLPSGTGVMAHELGHNMSRQHAPCGGVAGPDPLFPYAGGTIGVWGLDLTTLALKSPAVADLMGYCNPVWVSDYNWTAMVAYRQGGPNNAPAAGASGPGLLVWGRITPAGVVLEPAFTLAGSAGRAPTPGPHRLDLLAADGSLLRTVSFDAEEVADLPSGPERHFAFVIPLDGGLDASLAGLRVRAAGRVAARLDTGAGADPLPQLSRPNTQQVRLTWDAARYPMVLVRDAATGDILSFARGGSAQLWSRSRDFVLTFSNGVKSVTRTGRLLQ